MDNTPDNNDKGQTQPLTIANLTQHNHLGFFAPPSVIESLSSYSSVRDNDSVASKESRLSGAIAPDSLLSFEDYDYLFSSDDEDEQDNDSVASEGSHISGAVMPNSLLSLEDYDYLFSSDDEDEEDNDNFMPDNLMTLNIRSLG